MTKLETLNRARQEAWDKVDEAWSVAAKAEVSATAALAVGGAEQAREVAMELAEHARALDEVWRAAARRVTA
jgi:hypothetical protein